MAFVSWQGMPIWSGHCNRILVRLKGLGHGGQIMWIQIGIRIQRNHQAIVTVLINHAVKNVFPSPTHSCTFLQRRRSWPASIQDFYKKGQTIFLLVQPCQGFSIVFDDFDMIRRMDEFTRLVDANPDLKITPRLSLERLKCAWEPR